MILEQFPGRGKVAALKTRPETVLADIGEVMHLAGYQDALPRDHDTILKINISWQTWYPACSTTPWQLEGVIRTLQADGYRNLIGAHNGTVVVDARVGERNNKHKYVVDRYDVANVHLYEPHIEWVTFTPEQTLPGARSHLPRGGEGTQALLRPQHHPAADGQDPRLHTITGAMKNAFGGLLNNRRHHTTPSSTRRWSISCRSSRRSTPDSSR